MQIVVVNYMAHPSFHYGNRYNIPLYLQLPWLDTVCRQLWCVHMLYGNINLT